MKYSIGDFGALFLGLFAPVQFLKTEGWYNLVSGLIIMILTSFAFFCMKKYMDGKLVIKQ